jgi:peptidoglycan/xylan/chitin deacetylase (PgdA/CDA1 family)
MIALTFDDGPGQYTAHILDLLKQYAVPATFFVTGNNLGKGEIDNTATAWPGIILRMRNEGHQIASHTWSHQALGSVGPSLGQETLTRQQRLNQMYYNEMAFRNILGYFPTYMRPPYSDCDAGSGCQADMATLGYHVIYFDLDTEDYLNDSPAQIQTSKNDYSNNVGPSSPQSASWLVIGHDIHQQTAYNLTEFMITYAKARGWTFGTVGQCLGDPAANWYRSASGGGTVTTSSSGTPPASSTTSTSPTASGKTVSTDGTCGAAKGFTCQGSAFGTCCSQYNWCGTSTAHCGTGCQPGYGTCTGSGTTSSSTGGGTSTSSGPTTSPTAKVSVDGTCGGTGGFTCKGSTFGNCCSQYGWCGSTTAYCGTGCQPNFGTCG